MKGLIQKSGYIKPGSGGGHYAEYIATRDGVELMEAMAGGGYLEYIAERPRSHGLFSADGVADLEQTILDKGIMPSEKVLDFPVDCNTLTGSVNL